MEAPSKIVSAVDLSVTLPPSPLVADASIKPLCEIFSAVTTISPASAPDTSSVPLLLILPAEPASEMTPPSLSTRVALITPVLFTTLVNTSRATWPLSRTLPPCAIISPLLEMASSSDWAFSSTSPLTLNCSRPSPLKSSVAELATARLIEPTVARIFPSLMTPVSLIRETPPVEAEIRP